MTTRKIKLCKKPEIFNINNSKVGFYKQNNKTIFICSMIGSGICNESRDTAGISHLLEHVLTNAWKKCNYKNCDTYFNNQGITYNASTHDDFMLYYASGLIDDYKDILNYIIDIINNPKIIKKNIDKEKHAVKSELLGYLNDITSELENQFYHNFYKNKGLQYSYDWKVQLDNLKKFNVSDLNNWYKNHYNDISYFIIGDINKTELVDFLKKKIPYKKKITDLQTFTNTFSFKNQLVYVNNNNAKQVNIIFGFPNYITRKDKNFIFINIICSIIKNILFIKLRSELNLVYGISIYSETGKYGTTIYINVNANKDKAVLVINYILDYLNYYKNFLCSDKEISSIKKTFQYTFNNNINNNSNNRIFNQYKKQILYLDSFNSNKLISVCEIKKEINTIDKKKFQNLLIELFDTKTCLIIYQNSKKLKLNLFNN